MGNGWTLQTGKGQWNTKLPLPFVAGTCHGARVLK